MKAISERWLSNNGSVRDHLSTDKLICASQKLNQGHTYDSVHTYKNKQKFKWNCFLVMLLFKCKTCLEYARHYPGQNKLNADLKEMV